MSRLSISTAWDETKARLSSDGRLLMTVALALIAVPSAISTVVSPNSAAEGEATLTTGLVVLAMSLVALVGQLAIIRLAIGPSVSVGGAISHAAGRALPYVAAIILLVIVLVVLALPLIAVLVALGVSFEEADQTLPGGAWIAILIYFAAMIFVAVRMLMSSPVASAESVGPIKILKRSWGLTRGHTAKLLGFLAMFVIGLIVVLSAVSVMVGLLVRGLLGELEPMSAAALVIGLVQGLASAVATVIFCVMLARIYVQLSGGAAGDTEVTVPHSGT